MLPNPIIEFDLFGKHFSVHMYGVMIAVGLLACFTVLTIYFKKKKIGDKFTDFVFYNALVSIAAGFGSAAVFQALYNYIENPEKGFHITESITFIGGLIGGVICFLIVYFFFRKRYTDKLSDVISIIPCIILVAHAFGRVGCFFAGCCYGVETDSIFGVTFPNLHAPVHPTQLYEAAFLFVLFFICSYLVLKKDFCHNMSLYLIAYGTFRFLLEYLRGDERGEFLGGVLSPSQFWSLLMVVFGIGLYFAFKNFLKKAALQKAEEEEENTEDGKEPSENENTSSEDPSQEVGEE